MAEHDCGEIPVVDKSGHPIGVVTDRDIACRGVGQGKTSETPVSERLEDCSKPLEENQIRRVPVVDQGGTCCGMVSQADIAQHAPGHETAQVVREVSKPSSEPSRAGCC